MLSADALSSFFSAYVDLTAPKPVGLDVAALNEFFENFDTLRRELPAPDLVTRPPLDPVEFSAFCRDFNPLAEQSRRRGESINVWEVSGIGTNELRNAAILKWLLDPNGSHGRGRSILDTWLKEVLRDRPQDRFPLPVTGRFTIATETYPLANEESRVDIELDGRDFLLIVEVKIHAPESRHKVDRYLKLAEAKTGGMRPYLVLFVSPRPNPLLSSGNSDKVVSTTWEVCASALRSAVYESPRSERGRGDDLILQFARHIDNF